MAALILVLAVALAPGLFWLYIVYRRDKFHPEPRALVAGTFFLGMVVAVPVAAVEALLEPHPVGTSEPLNLETAAYVAFVVAGITEEIGKFVVVRGTVYSSRYFDEPIDGIVYSSAAALGFASLENVLYVLRFGIEIMLIRGPVSSLGHAVFSAFWGYPLALRKVHKQRTSFGTIAGLLAAIVVHGLFDFTLFAGGDVSLAFIPLFIAGAVIFFAMIGHALKVSHYG
ncbi:MAG: PrsW family intramembrane metalloprotease [Chloroflexi bacterium]|nr:PrsW family intramembrane metalloprotease [Chloroflexota bacterium]